MEPNSTLEILKQAILLEKRGKVFYTSAAENAKNPEVRNIFELMAAEEEIHIKVLSDQYIHYKDHGKFDHLKIIDIAEGGGADESLIRSVIGEISAAGYEATAISMAMDMESRAIAAYSERAANAADPEEKGFYEWLAGWERGHYQVLYMLDQELKERIWNDNSFWPF